MGKELGVPDQAIHDGLARCVVKGRVELVPISKQFTILLDYAHNEVSTESLLTTLRAYNPHRLVVVFGCGGNRSKLRRYGMGEICAKMADFSRRQVCGDSRPSGRPSLCGGPCSAR